MNHEKHPHFNTQCRPPANWDDRGGALRLPVLYAMQGEAAGVKVFLTRWKPAPEELQMLLAGGEIELVCVGGQPACAVHVIEPAELGGGRIVLPN